MLPSSIALIHNQSTNLTYFGESPAAVIMKTDFRFCYFLLGFLLIALMNLTFASEEGFGSSNETKLLIILIDGFRWDYYERQKFQLPGLTQLISNGVQTQWVEPIFPSLSFPSWTTIATGLYPENHNILGNYMLHSEDQEFPETVFHLKDNSTLLPNWWQAAEPLWITVTKNNKKAFLANWARCEVPFEGILPAECTGYTYQNINKGFRDDINTAVKRLKNGFSLAMVYDDFIDHVGHQFGPDSNEIRMAMVQRDSVFQELLLNLQVAGMTNKVNIILTSDHGMTSLKKDSGVKFIQLSNYIDEDDVYKVIDYGAVVSIAAATNRSEPLYEDLKTLPGIDVYRKEDIPEIFHFKRSRLVHDFLLVAMPGFAIVGLKGDKQIPNDSKASSLQPYSGSHGYYNMTDMRTIFYAKGPAFKKGITHPPIGLQDEYQIFMDVLQLSPLSNNGSWRNVDDMFQN